MYVAFFLKDLLPRTPDLVVSGINHGPNLGNDVHYSGTVAAAREGALRGVPSIAFSNSSSDMEGAAQYAKRFCKQLLRSTPRREAKPCFSTSTFPSVPPKGIRATRLGFRLYSDEVEVRDDPRGRHYLWIGGPGGATSEPVEGADTEALDEGFISVTPLSIEAHSRTIWASQPSWRGLPRSDDRRPRELLARAHSGCARLPEGGHPLQGHHAASRGRRSVSHVHSTHGGQARR